jgi:broad specificity phosphatase PhoE
MSRRIAAFIRHADYEQLVNTPSALQPFGLNENGVKQAHQSALDVKAFIEQNKWQITPVFHCSSLLRSWQTADIFAKHFESLTVNKIRIASFDQLVERSVGAAANLTTKQIEAIIDNDPRFDALPAKWKSDSYFKLPLTGAESLMDAGNRVAKHLSDTMSSLATSDHDQVTLFFGHGASFRHAAHILGILEFDQIAALSMYHASPIYLEYNNQGQWQHIAGEWKVRSKHSEYTD